MSLHLTVSLDLCPHCGRAEQTLLTRIFTGNIHEMYARVPVALGKTLADTIYNGPTDAAMLHAELAAGLTYLREHPELAELDDPSGWGSRDALITCLRQTVYDLESRRSDWARLTVTRW